MDIKADINWIHQEIDTIKDPSFIDKLKHLLQSKREDVISSDIDYNVEIEKALENISKGKFYAEEDAMMISKKWGRK